MSPFHRQNDITGVDGAAPTLPTEGFNSTVDLVIKANSFTSAVFPKPGKLAFGNSGIEFVADEGNGFMEIPWPNIERVMADIIGSYVRSIRIFTDETAPLDFVISDGANALRCIRDHIGRESIEAAPSSFRQVGHDLKTKVGSVFHKKDRDASKRS